MEFLIDRLGVFYNVDVSSQGFSTINWAVWANFKGIFANFLFQIRSTSENLIYVVNVIHLRFPQTLRMKVTSKFTTCLREALTKFTRASYQFYELWLPSLVSPASRNRLKACSSVEGSTPFPNNCCFAVSSEKGKYRIHHRGNSKYWKK